MRIKILITLLLVLGSSLGQPLPREGRMDDRNMDAIRIWKLTEVLELTEDQVVTFLPLVQVHERELKAIHKELMTLSKEAHADMEADEVTQKEVDKYLKQYVDKQNEIIKIKNDFVASLPDHLSPEQQLRYLSFETRFRKDLREYMKQERRGMNRSKMRNK